MLHEPRRDEAALVVLVQVAERLDRAHSAPGEVLRDVLHQDTAEPAVLELRDHPQRGEQHRVRADRAGRERRGARHRGGRRVERVPGGHVVDVEDPAAGTPVQQHVGDPGLLLETGFAELLGLLPDVRREFPEHAATALRWQVVEVVQRDAYDASRHPDLPCNPPEPTHGRWGAARISRPHRAPEASRPSQCPSEW